MCECTQHGRYGLFKPGLQEEYYYSKTQMNQGGEEGGGGGGEEGGEEGGRGGGGSAINSGKLIVRHKLRSKRLPPTYLINITYIHTYLLN